MDDNAVSYYKSETVRLCTPSRVSWVFWVFFAGCFSHLPVSESSKPVSQEKEPLRSIPLRDIQKVHECLVKSG